MIEIGIVKGLKNINNFFDEQEKKREAREARGDAPKTAWFKIDDKQQVKVKFLQELDEDAPGYSEKNGLGFLAVEHQSPQNFRNKALCTADEGDCWACEQKAEDFQGWKQRNRLYINVLVDDGKGDPEVKVLSQGNGPKSITPTLLEYAQEDGLTDKWFKIKRTGSGQQDTAYLMLPATGEDVKVEDYDVFDLDNVVRHVPYEKQEAHYGYTPDSSSNRSEPAISTAPKAEADADW